LILAAFFKKGKAMTTKAEYINRVMLIMNESGLYDSSGNNLIGADIAQVDRHIEGSFVDAWRRCVKVMPRAWFRNDIFIDAKIVPDLDKGIGYIVLPDDFYLLTALKMKGWVKAVYECYIQNEKTASIQSNEYTRGSEIRPVCTVSNKYVDNKVKQVLNYYSLPKGLDKHEVTEAIYVPVCRPLNEYELNDDLGLDAQILEPLAYLSASTVFTMFEKYDIAQSLEQRAIEMFPGLQSVRGNNITIKQ